MKLTDMTWKSFTRHELIGSCESGGCIMHIYNKDDKWYALINSSAVYELNAHDLHVYRNHITRVNTADEMSKAMAICQRKAFEHKDIAGFYMSAYSEFQKRYEKLKEIADESKKAD